METTKLKYKVGCYIVGRCNNIFIITNIFRDTLYGKYLAGKHKGDINVIGFGDIFGYSEILTAEMKKCMIKKELLGNGNL